MQPTPILADLLAVGAQISIDARAATVHIRPWIFFHSKHNASLLFSWMLNSKSGRFADGNSLAEMGQSAKPALPHLEGGRLRGKRSLRGPTFFASRAMRWTLGGSTPNAHGFCFTADTRTATGTRMNAHLLFVRASLAVWPTSPFVPFPAPQASAIDYGRI